MAPSSDIERLMREAAALRERVREENAQARREERERRIRAAEKRRAVKKLERRAARAACSVRVVKTRVAERAKCAKKKAPSKPKERKQTAARRIKPRPVAPGSRGPEMLGEVVRPKALPAARAPLALPPAPPLKKRKVSGIKRRKGGALAATPAQRRKAALRRKQTQVAVGPRVSVKGIHVGRTYLIRVGKSDQPVLITGFPSTGGIEGRVVATGRPIHITFASKSRRFKGELAPTGNLPDKAAGIELPPAGGEQRSSASPRSAKQPHQILVAHRTMGRVPIEVVSIKGPVALHKELDSEQTYAVSDVETGYAVRGGLNLSAGKRLLAALGSSNGSALFAAAKAKVPNAASAIRETISNAVKNSRFDVRSIPSLSALGIQGYNA